MKSQLYCDWCCVPLSTERRLYLLKRVQTDRLHPDRRSSSRRGPGRQGPERQPLSVGSRQTGTDRQGPGRQIPDGQGQTGSDSQGPDRHVPDGQGPDRQGADRQGAWLEENLTKKLLPKIGVFWKPKSVAEKTAFDGPLKTYRTTVSHCYSSTGRSKLEDKYTIAMHILNDQG